MSHAVAKKRPEVSEVCGRSARSDAEPTNGAGVPAFLGGAASGGATPAFLQRQPMDIVDEAEPEEAEATDLVQRLPQDPFPNGEDEAADPDASDALVQPKLEVNTPGDAFEQEADGVAEAVTKGTDAPSIAASGAAPELQRTCAICGGDK